jgi:hypothetical protein
MTQEELFIKNLSFIENLEQWAINALIGKFIFKTQVKVFKMHYPPEQGLMRSKTVAVGKIDTNPSFLHREFKNKSKSRRYSPQAEFFDVKTWERLPDFGFSSIEILKLLKVLEDYTFYLTFNEGQATYTFFNKYQVSGTFENATSRSVILIYAVKNNLDFAEEDLQFLIPEDLYLPEKPPNNLKGAKDLPAEQYPSKFGRESAKDGFIIRRNGAFRNAKKWAEKHVDTQRFTVEDEK